MLSKSHDLLLRGAICFLCLFTYAEAERAEMLWEVPIESQHQHCLQNDDCTAVKTSCNDCECFGNPVNKRYVALYEKRKKELCESYRGPHCLMRCGDASFECMNRRCIIMSSPVPPLDHTNK